MLNTYTNLHKQDTNENEYITTPRINIKQGQQKKKKKNRQSFYIFPKTIDFWIVKESEKDDKERKLIFSDILAYLYKKLFNISSNYRVKCSN